MGRRSFSREFKLEAVRLVRARGVSVAQAARDLELSCREVRGRSMRVLSTGILALVFALGLRVPQALCEGRFALLIGNQAYDAKVGPLKNPHNDVDLIAEALAKLGFRTTLIKDAGYKAVDTALRRHIQEVRRAGKETI